MLEIRVLQRRSFGPVAFTPPPFVALALASLLATQGACSSTSRVPLAYGGALAYAQHGTIVLRDEHGRTTPVTPDSQLRFERLDGTSTPTVRAGDLCRTAEGFAASSSAGCADARPLVAFDEIALVHVDTFDRAATTGLITVGAAAVIVAVVAIVALSGKDDEKKPESDSDAGGSRGAPERNEATEVNGSSRRGAADGQGGAEVLGASLRLGADLTAQAIEDHVREAAPTTGMGALFHDRDRRRMTAQLLVAADGSGSLFTPQDSVAGGARVGVRLYDFFDASFGVRSFAGEGRDTRAAAVLALGFHGPFPRARWLALGLGFEGGLSQAIDLHASAYAGLRVAPLSRLWLGLYPLHPSYTSWSGGRGGRWVAASTFDIVYTY
jgi:hypothetical protein